MRGRVAVVAGFVAGFLFAGAVPEGEVLGSVTGLDKVTHTRICRDGKAYVIPPLKGE